MNGEKRWEKKKNLSWLPDKCMWDLETCFPFLKVYSSFCFPKSLFLRSTIFQASGVITSTKYSFESFQMKKVLVYFWSFMYFTFLKAARDRCETKKCEYGVLRYRDDRSKCIECYCNEPCYGYQCPSGTKCSVDLEQTKSGSVSYR